MTFQLKKLQDKVEKSRKDVEITHDKYESALRDLNSRNAKYMEDMTEVGDKRRQQFTTSINKLIYILFTYIKIFSVT